MKTKLNIQIFSNLLNSFRWPPLQGKKEKIYICICIYLSSLLCSSKIGILDWDGRKYNHVLVNTHTQVSRRNKFPFTLLMVFPIVMYRCKYWTIKWLRMEELMLSNCGAGKCPLTVPWTAVILNQSILKKSTLNIHWKDWCESSNTLVTWCEELTHWKWPWCWERLRAGGEEGNRG